MILYVLTVVDFAALLVGLCILRRVTKQVHETGDAINTAIAGAIEDARSDVVAKFIGAVGPALGQLAQTVPGIVSDAVSKAVGGITISVQGGVDIETQRQHNLSLLKGNS